MLPISYLFSNMLNEPRGKAQGGRRNGQKMIGRREKGRKKIWTTEGQRLIMAVSVKNSGETGEAESQHSGIRLRNEE